MWVMGEDVVQTDPNTEHVKKAMERARVLRGPGALHEPRPPRWRTWCCPASSFLEKSGTFTNGERRVQRVNAVIDPLSGTKPDGQIVMRHHDTAWASHEGLRSPAGVLAEIAPHCALLQRSHLGQSHRARAPNGPSRKAASAPSACTRHLQARPRQDSTSSASRRARSWRPTARTSPSSSPPAASWSTTTAAP